MTDAANITALRTDADLRRLARAAFILDLLKGERWSIRQAAPRLGMSHSALASRVNGSTSFLAEEIEGIAVLLHRDPVRLYADYLSAGNDNRPAIGGNRPGPVYLLPHQDSNLEPIDSQPLPHVAPVIPGKFGRPQRDVTPRPLARISAARFRPGSLDPTADMR